MATRRYAKSLVTEPNVQFDRWMDEIRSQHEGAVSKDHVHRIAKTVLRKCDPKQYLLSHATIVASVDTYAPKRAKIGKQLNRGCEIDVRWPEYRIKPECLDIVNNNGDAWERSLLLSSYRTFIGAPNYLEHIQLPELSKGFIVDAIARDLGKTCYIDILVATDRKHKTLIQDILSGKISAMSMGCISLFTTCTKCGNVAADDSQLCPCVQYDGKRSAFIDEDDGIETIVAEIIGHVSVPNSNQFIEASWVRQPAFAGAQRRSFLNAEEQNPVFASKLSESNRIYEVRQLIPDMEGIRKAARLRTAEDAEEKAPGGLDDEEEADLSDVDTESDDVPSGSGGDSGGSGDKPKFSDSDPKEQKPKIDEFVEKAQEMLLEMIVKGLGEKLQPKPEDVGSVTPSSVDSNNNNLVRSFDERLQNRFGKNPHLVRWASRAWRAVATGDRRAIRDAGLKPKDLIVLSWIVDRLEGRYHPAALYKLAMQLGPISAFPSETSYLAAGSMRAGRELTDSEREFMRRKGRVAALAQF